MELSQDTARLGRQLPPEVRYLLAARLHQDGMPLRQIAIQVGGSTGSVKYLIDKGWELLREQEEGR